MKLNARSLVAAVASVGASTVLFAQTAPPTPSTDTSSAQSTQPAASSMPSSSQPANSQTNPGGSTKSKSAQMQNCIAQQRSQNPGQSDQAIKQACKSQIDTENGGTRQ
jgi:hypothetical protein